MSTPHSNFVRVAVIRCRKVYILFHKAHSVRDLMQNTLCNQLMRYYMSTWLH